MRKLIELTGKRFGSWVVVRKATTIGGNVMWECQCDCGVIRNVRSVSLRDGRSTSCGCMAGSLNAKAHRKHGHAQISGEKSLTYSSWSAMRTRCYNTNSPGYRKYGSRGITVCDRWRHSFANFLADMGVRPNGVTLDRIDNNGNYEPGNCRWATPLQQQNNIRTNVIVTFNGESLSVSEWSRRTGIHKRTLYNRIKTGWPIEEALTSRPSFVKRHKLHAG